MHVGCLCVSHTSYSPNPKQIGFRRRRKPSVWSSPWCLLRRNPINLQHMVIGYGMDYGPYNVCGPLPAPMVTWWCYGTRSLTRRLNWSALFSLLQPLWPKGGGGQLSVNPNSCSPQQRSQWLCAWCEHCIETHAAGWTCNYQTWSCLLRWERGQVYCVSFSRLFVSLHNVVSGGLRNHVEEEGSARRRTRAAEGCAERGRV